MGENRNNNVITEMQQFAIDFLKKENKDVSPSYLATAWIEHKTGRYIGASRYRFGYTSAAYRTLRSLEKMGIVQSIGNDRYYKIIIP